MKYRAGLPVTSILCFFFFSLLLNSSARSANELPHLGWIPIQCISSDKPTTLDLTRWFSLRPDDKIELTPPASLSAKLDLSTRQLKIQTQPDLQGLIDLSIQITPKKGEPLSGILTLAIPPRYTHRFTFKGKGSEKSVYLAGTFNGWNPSSHPLSREKGNLWSLSLPLSPGPQIYKLVVDGDWRLDPAHSLTLADGTGEKNSLVKIPDHETSPTFLYAESHKPGLLTFLSAPAGWKSSSLSCVAELPNGTSRLIPATHPAPGRWEIDTSSLPPDSWIRLAAVGQDGTLARPARASINPETKTNANRLDHIIYFAFIDRMVDGDPKNNPSADTKVEKPAQYLGGDLIGLRQLIENGYFEKLGVNTLWLSPVNQNPPQSFQEYLPPGRWYTGYHGYWPLSSTEVEPRFGGNEALLALTESARQHGLRVLLDLVLAHVHQDNPVYKDHPDWFGSLTLPDGTKNLRKWDAETQFTTWFEPFLPRFNYDQSAASQFLISNAVDWVKRFNLDGFRLDAVKHIPPKFWSAFRSGLRSDLSVASDPSFYLVGETFMSREGIASFVGPAKLDGQFDFPLYDTLLSTFALGSTGFPELEAAVTDSERVYGLETAMSPLLGNHDKPRFLAYVDGDLPDPREPDEEEAGWKYPSAVNHPSSYAKLRMAFTFLMTLSGVPMIYYGDEMGLTGAGDPDNRRMLPDPEKASGEAKATLDHVSKLTHLRSAHPALRYGSRRAIEAKKDTYAIIRAYQGDRVLIAFNRSDKAVVLDLLVSPELPDGPLNQQLPPPPTPSPFSSAKPTPTPTPLFVKNGHLTLNLPPLSSSLLLPAYP
jgi:cyclomaltodextrinase